MGVVSRPRFGSSPEDAMPDPRRHRRLYRRTGRERRSFISPRYENIIIY